MPPGGFSSLRRAIRRQGGKRQKRISAILRTFSHTRREEPTIGELSQAFDTRAFGAFFILFGGLNLVPLPPPASFFIGLPLMFFTFQLAIGRHRLWLPNFVGRMRLSPDRIALVMDKIGPMLRRIERLARHRYWLEPERLLLPLLGWYSFIMATIVAIPFPLTNLIPGISVALVGVAISTRDGLWLAAALITGVIGIVVLGGFYGAAAFAVLQLF
ncbi:exopolysaccharide biosynthesis protein [Jiella pacifica]|uniref:Exopolysaccharide biosynthesis protein n=1 Tax=Jiella pacifica TaxID=2696469 RepID=A0A6N9T375_9HYPH|nr:exopolysaccharide biosynthesis protein [Jiella pacifica]NDW05032.1 exopolysaccharide biosynthesis protein [Jiella pacifica]